MPFCKLYYHVVWSTKYRTPLMTPDVEPIIHDFLRTKALGLEAVVYALNGVADHVHMVVSIPPKIAVAKFIGQVKAVASTKFNKLGRTDLSFFWQDEYAAFSFDEKRLPNYVAYVERQKEHHAEQSIIPVLEITEPPQDRRLNEELPLYAFEDEAWRQELESLAAAWLGDGAGG